MVLSLQEEARIKNSQELIQLLRELQRSTSQAAREIGTAAHQVRDYPVEVLNQHRARMEQCLAKCEAAAIASKEYFDKSRAVMDGYGKELRGEKWVHFFGPVNGKTKVDSFIGYAAHLGLIRGGTPSGLYC